MTPQQKANKFEDDFKKYFISEYGTTTDYYRISNKNGSYHSDKEAYVFNIVRHIQNLLNPILENRLENRGLFLVVNEARTNANGLVLKNQEGLKAAHINIIYTLIK